MRRTPKQNKKKPLSYDKARKRVVACIRKVQAPYLKSHNPMVIQPLCVLEIARRTRLKRERVRLIVQRLRRVDGVRVSTLVNRKSKIAPGLLTFLGRLERERPELTYREVLDHLRAEGVEATEDHANFLLDLARRKARKLGPKDRLTRRAAKNPIPRLRFRRLDVPRGVVEFFFHNPTVAASVIVAFWETIEPVALPPDDAQVLRERLLRLYHRRLGATDETFRRA